MLKKSKNYKKAIEHLTEAEKYFSKEVRVYIEKAKMYYKIKEYEKAYEELQKGKKINPKSIEIKNEMEKIKTKLVK